LSQQTSGLFIASSSGSIFVTAWHGYRLTRQPHLGSRQITALVGVDNIVVVETPDALLIVPATVPGRREGRQTTRRTERKDLV